MADRTVVQYYSILKYLSGVYDRTSRRFPAPRENAVALAGWQQKAREKLWELLGLTGMESCPLNAERYASIQLDGYRLERVSIQSAPDLFIPLIVLVPDGIKQGEKRPVLLHSFGHGNTISMIDSFLPQESEATPLEKAMRSIRIGPGSLMQLAKAGYLVIAADARGSGERIDFAGATGEYINIGMDNPLNNIAISFGMSKLGMEVWDLMRMADYALTREDCDGRIGTGGTSGGGHQSLFFGALDTRVHFTATSTWFYGFQDALMDQPHNCSCNYVPELFTYFDCCDIGSMIAPRALHVETGWRDSLSSQAIGLGNVLSHWDTTWQSFSLLDVPDRLSLWVFDGGHGCNPWDNPDRTTPQSGAKFEETVKRWLPISPEKGGQAE